MEKITVKGYPMHNPVHACIGCEKATGWTATGYVCPVYDKPHKVYAIRVFGVCPFNNSKLREPSSTRKVRVGQQKQRKRR